MEEWLALIEALAELRRHGGVDLAVIDALGTFLPGRNENSAGVMMECLLPLQRLTSLGRSVLLLHHPRKGRTVAGQAARAAAPCPPSSIF
jgi:RecA-family ATPase